MLAALERREISAPELLELHARRIERYDPELNAIPVRLLETAREAADLADLRRLRGDAAPLLGLPVTIKETIEVAGLPATAGRPARQACPPEAHGPVADRVLGAGAVLLGKTNVPTDAMDWQSNNPIYGRTVNPWDPARTPGGSTGGGAAALAAGLSPLEFGSDIGGSIRVPAAFCGVYGHRPSDSLVPNWGHAAIYGGHLGRDLPSPARVLMVQGPLARSAADLELALDVLAGPGAGFEVAWRLRLPPSRHLELAGFRVAVMPFEPWLPVDPEIVAGLETVAERLRAAGSRVSVSRPDFDFREHEKLYGALLAALSFAGFPELRRRRFASEARSEDEFGEARASGIDASLGTYLELLAGREAIREAYRRFFREFDVLLTPATIVPAFPHIDPGVPFAERSLTVAGEQVPYSRLQCYPGLATLAGQPATVFPAGRTRSGLPIGLQAIGPFLEDRTPLTFAAALEPELGGFQPPPAYSR